MSHDLDLWSSPSAPQRLWSVRKRDRELTAELLTLGEYGCEIQLFRDRGFYSSKRFETVDRALRSAERIVRTLEAEGWTRSS
jgi:hypothetical protein